MRELAEAQCSGHENARDIELFRDFYLNGRIDISVSPFGQQTGLPIEMTSIHCEHAPFFGARTMQATDLAVEFYEENCIDCPHRTKLGRLPNIASEAAERRRSAAEGAAAAQRGADLRRDAWRTRKSARAAALVSEPHRVRVRSKRPA